MTFSPSHTHRPFGGPSGGPAPDRELGGYNGRRSNFGLEASYGRMERFNEDIDPYYNSFSDPPHSPVSRDYHHGESWCMCMWLCFSLALLLGAADFCFS